MEFRDETLSIDERVADLVSRLTVEEKIGLLTSSQQPIERLGIQARSIGTEFARGWSSHDETEYCTVFPQTIGMASTFDEELIYKAGQIAGREARAYYYSKNKSLFGFGPTVDLERDPRWGRHEEGYGEDPYLTATMATAYTKGLAGMNLDGTSETPIRQTMPLLKHFICNNTETDRATYDVQVSKELLEDYYLEVFRRPIMEGGAVGVMGAYNKINGEPGLLTSLNQEYVKDAWGGRLVVSDGHAFAMVMEEHKYTKSHAETMALALKAGANIMLDAPEMVMGAAREAYEQGMIDEALIDRAITDTLALRFMLGEFDAEDPYSYITMNMVNTDEDKQVALTMAEEQVILLKNDGILPFAKDNSPRKIALVGPQADENFLDWYTGASSYDTTVRAGFEELIQQGNEEKKIDTEILYDSGRDIVRLKDSRTGKYLRVLDDLSGRVDASAEDASEFEQYDWGWGYVNFMDRKTGKMLQEDENIIRCTAKDAYMWFVRPILTPTVTPEGTTLVSWNHKNIAMNPEGELYLVEDGDDTAPALWDIEVISDADDRCRKLAEEADVVIVCAGNHPTQVGREGFDRESILLPPRQDNLVREMCAANPNTILLMVSSYPYGIDEHDRNCRGVVYTTHAGPELGHAVANIFWGDANPSGRTASTWYKADYKFPSIFDYNIVDTKMTYMYMEEEPLYPFGYGLSYSTFEHGPERIVAEDEDSITYVVDVTNTSDRDGAEVVLIYHAKDDPAEPGPHKKLIGYARANIAAGATETVTIVCRR